ncbi:hypothetical protein BDM02DRAFT_1403985 [Thelephora ganbajun]|uniref:Uncharacterized protein n=1 Tax=Thelephora ganbajun TaxID=370292 RepID=A0ACB6Z2L5_THEGA|nr:hypothetical protein BDM02DRAFT_1403985 [Thelephora ganbajun]
MTVTIAAYLQETIHFLSNSRCRLVAPIPCSHPYRWPRMREGGATSGVRYFPSGTPDTSMQRPEQWENLSPTKFERIVQQNATLGHNFQYSNRLLKRQTNRSFELV